MKTFIIAAVSADGYIAETEHQLATTWTSKADRKVFRTLTKRAGVFVMGRTTFDTIGRALPDRRNIIYSRQPLAVEDVEVTSLPPGELLASLAQEGYEEVAICGGRSIYDLFMRAGLVDELYLTVEPVLFGKGITLFSDINRTNLSLIATEKLNDDTILLHYKVIA